LAREEFDLVTYGAWGFLRKEDMDIEDDTYGTQKEHY
jgi:hypothetical protein